MGSIEKRRTDFPRLPPLGVNMVLYVLHDAGELIGVWSSLATAKKAIQSLYTFVLDFYSYGPKLWSAVDTDIIIEEVYLDRFLA